MKLTRLLVIVIVSLMVLSMTACTAATTSATTTTGSVESSKATTTSENPTTTAKEARTIGFIMIGGAIEHCRIFDSGVREICEANGDEVITLDAVIDASKVASLVDDLIAKKVDAIIIEGFDQELHIGAIKAANAAGIICVQSDNWCKDESITVGQAASDNFDAGYQCGLDAIKKLGGPNIKAIVLTNPGSPASDDRTNGFIKAVEEAGGKIVAEQKAIGAELGAQVADELLQANPDANVIMANHDPAAMGALAAVKSINKVGKILIYGVDGNTENLEAIKRGEITGTAKQNPLEMGKASAQFLYDYWNKVPNYVKKVTIPVSFINADNIADYLK